MTNISDRDIILHVIERMRVQHNGRREGIMSEPIAAVYL